MSDDRWLSKANYEHLQDLSPAALSWEFLRRNTDYRRDFEATRDGGASSGVSMADTHGLTPAWGLVFPGGPRTVGGGAAGLLAR
jgi:hypothetical protein